MEPSDRERFDRALGVLAYSTNGDRKLPPHVCEAYWRSLRKHPMPEVLDALTAKLHVAGKMPSVGELLTELASNDTDSFHQRRARELDQQRSSEAAEADRIGLRRFGFELWNAPNFIAMKRKANVAYSKRVSGMAPEATAFSGGAYHEYTGGFDFDQVVMAAPLPRSARLAEQQRAWEGFWKLLREEYLVWIDANPDQIAEGVDIVRQATRPPYADV
jgi:hypothetical protein